jgi:CHAT domain-containing protein
MPGHPAGTPANAGCQRAAGGCHGARQELAHVAAHGTFRGDNPLFSSLQLDDGPLTVYDLESLGRAPYRLVLSSCESGRAAPAGADELLGLASSMMPMGTAGIIAAVVPVSDRVTPGIMDSLHERVAQCAGLPERCGWRG